jgi:hypothetical protein
MTREWRPKVGELVWSTRERAMVELLEDDGGGMPFRTSTKLALHTRWHLPHEVLPAEPLPAAAEPRAPWEVLDEAADILAQTTLEHYADGVRQCAIRLKAAAAPKPPPSLAEAVRAYLKAADDGPVSEFEPARSAMVEALARAEAGR